jgi:hypothetical protein
MGSRLDLNLGSHTILGDPSHNPKETIAGRLLSWIVPKLLTSELRCQSGEIRSIDRAPPTRPHGRLEPTRVGPPTHSVNTHSQKLCRLTDPVLRHLHKVARAEATDSGIGPYRSRGSDFLNRALEGLVALRF